MKKATHSENFLISQKAKDLLELQKKLQKLSKHSAKHKSLRCLNSSHSRFFTILEQSPGNDQSFEENQESKTETFKRNISSIGESKAKKTRIETSTFNNVTPSINDNSTLLNDNSSSHRETYKKIVKIAVKKLPPPPPRKVLIEKLPALPSRPACITIERWLPYPEAKRKVILKIQDSSSSVSFNIRNSIILWKTPEVKIEQSIKYLGVIKANPVEYVEKYGKTLVNIAKNDSTVLISPISPMI